MVGGHQQITAKPSGHYGCLPKKKNQAQPTAVAIAAMVAVSRRLYDLLNTGIEEDRKMGIYHPRIFPAVRKHSLRGFFENNFSRKIIPTGLHKAIKEGLLHRPLEATALECPEDFSEEYLNICRLRLEAAHAIAKLLDATYPDRPKRLPKPEDDGADSWRAARSRVISCNAIPGRFLRSGITPEPA
jgi:hypothetical protein